MQRSLWLFLVFIFFVFIFFPLPSFAQEGAAAIVNGVPVMKRDVELAVDQKIPRASFHGGVTEEKRDALRQQALQDLVTQELQHQDARTRGLKPDKKQVRSQMDQIRKRFKSKKEYKSALEQAGMTEDQLRLRVEKQVLVSTAIEKTVTEPARVSEAELKEYYAKNTKKFRKPEAFRLRIISLSNEGKAKETLVRLKAGEDFGTVAATTSEDNYRIKGGDIGYIHEGRLVPELEKEVLGLKSGEVRGPVKAEGKWYIMKLEDRKAAYQMSFDESRDKLKNELERKRSTELMEQWTSRLRAAAKIEFPDKK